MVHALYQRRPSVPACPGRPSQTINRGQETAGIKLGLDCGKLERITHLSKMLRFELRRSRVQFPSSSFASLAFVRKPEENEGNREMGRRSSGCNSKSRPSC